MRKAYKMKKRYRSHLTSLRKHSRHQKSPRKTTGKPPRGSGRTIKMSMTKTGKWRKRR
ncbi:MAG: hypothetical protein AABW79_02795 [Nanoarchaeota archaeon]